MRLFIAEKPSLAREIAANLGNKTGGSSAEGFIRVGSGDVVTWCFGHMLENIPPEEYDGKWKSWDVSSLPIVVKNWKLKPKEKVGKQLKVIQGLLKEAGTVVNAGDPDREGQLLVDEVLDYYGWRGKTLRILLNATDEASVKKALASMRDNGDFKNLYSAALCRSRADWLVGMNLTRAATRTFGKGDGVINVGRVQTPTLALVVRRDNEIANFKAQTFYNLSAKVKAEDNELTMEHSPKGELRIFDKKIAQALANEIKGKKFPLSIDKKKKREGAPLPYMLSTFQKDSEKFLGLGAKESLDVLQALYEAKLTSYPRSDHEKLPHEQAADATRIASAIVNASIVDAGPLLPLMQPSKRVYSLPKDAEHHGIIPTGKTPRDGQLDARHLKAYELVCKRFLLSLLPDYEFEETVVSFFHQERQFLQSGEVPINTQKSWRALEPKTSVKSMVLKGEPKDALVQEVEIKTGKTTPPDAYTESSLIEDMRSVAKYVSDERLKARLKETSGIGTAATQAQIIETLKTRQFIKPVGKKLRATDLGKYVIEKIPAPLADPGVTAAWEDALSMVADGKYSAQDFMNRTEIFVQSQLNKILKR